MVATPYRETLTGALKDHERRLRDIESRPPVTYPFPLNLSAWVAVGGAGAGINPSMSVRLEGPNLRMRGSCAPATGFFANGALMGTLGAAYCPTTAGVFPAPIVSGPGFSRIAISTSGAITLVLISGSIGLVWFDGITFAVQ